MWTAFWLIAFVHLVVVYLADSSALSVDAMTFGKFLKNVTGSKNIDRARKYAMMGIAISVVCRGFSAASGMMLFSDRELQCTGSYAQNYTDGDANTLSMLTSDGALKYDADAIKDICGWLRTVEINYWLNILLNCWFGIIAAKQVLGKYGLLALYTANAFTASVYFSVLLHLNTQHEGLDRLGQLAFWYLPYLVGAAVMLLSTSFASFNGISLPSDLLFIKWGTSVLSMQAKNK